jgi:hypothetical protein
MRDTGVFVSAHTSNLANSVLLQPGSAVVEIIQVTAVDTAAARRQKRKHNSSGYLLCSWVHSFVLYQIWYQGGGSYWLDLVWLGSGWQMLV